ncbi:MAG: hypothetical protein Q4A29_05840 [Eubacteriales bacterium]|nr:hypothetical protein [Eubacteriales bacterium]
MEFWNNLDPTVRTYIIWVGGFLIAYMIGMILYMKSRKNFVGKWLAENPTAAKVYVISKAMAIRSEGLVINSVDGQPPVHFQEGTKLGFYVLPGTRVVESTFTASRPGVMYKTVSTTYGPTKQEITVEANKVYQYKFNLKEERYEFEEIQK